MVTFLDLKSKESVRTKAKPDWVLRERQKLTAWSKSKLLPSHQKKVEKSQRLWRPSIKVWKGLDSISTATKDWRARWNRWTRISQRLCTVAQRRHRSNSILNVSSSMPRLLLLHVTSRLFSSLLAWWSWISNATNHSNSSLILSFASLRVRWPQKSAAN